MTINPILKKDLKTKLRGWRSTILICCYVTLLTGILFLYFASSNMFNPRSYQSFAHHFLPRLTSSALHLLTTC